MNSRAKGPVGAAFQDHGGLAGARAIDIEHTAADIDGTPNLRIALAVACTLRLLKQKPAD